MKTTRIRATVLVALTLVSGICAPAFCEISREDYLALFDYEDWVKRVTPPHVPITREPESLRIGSVQGSTAQCVAVGPLRFLHIANSLSLYILDIGRAFEPWERVEARDALRRQVEITNTIGICLRADSLALAQFYGRSPYTRDEIAVLKAALSGSVPAPTQITIPTRAQLVRPEAMAADGRLDVLINQLILHRVLAYLSREEPLGVVTRIEVPAVNPAATVILVRIVGVFREAKGTEVALTLPLNRHKAPYVGVALKR
jgi:hypothetical protein